MNANDVDFCQRDKRNAGEPAWFTPSMGAACLASYSLGLPTALLGGLINVPRRLLLGEEKKVIGKQLHFPPVDKCLLPEADVKPHAEREFDIVVYGATGFTGGLAAKYLAKQYGTSLKWAIAGRRKDALEKVRSELVSLNPNLPQDHVQIIQVDSSNDAQLQGMCARTRVVVTTVGPFVNYGTPLVRAAIATKSNVCDITGEVDWHSGLIEHYDEEARKAGSRIVSFCGHDSIPWDLTTYILAKRLKDEKNDELAKIELIDAIRSSPSGGTLATILEGMPPKVYKPQRLDFSPLRLTESGTASPFRLVDNSPILPNYTSTKQWSGPFVMALVNSKVVERSNALNGYGKKVSYSECRAANSLTTVIGRYLELMTLFPILLLPTSLQAKFLPQPGEGPSEEYMDTCFLQVTGVATGTKGSKTGGRMYFKTDPGYRDTARMLVETGLSIALSPEGCARSGGVLTPGSCCADVLFKRLLDTGTEFSFISNL